MVLLDAVRDLAEKWDDAAHRLGFRLRIREVDIPRQQVDREVHEGLRGADQLGPRFRMLANVLVGILAAGELNDRDVRLQLALEAEQAVCGRNGLDLRVKRVGHCFQAAKRRHLARSVRVERQYDPAAAPLDLGDLRLGEGGSHRRHDVPVAELVGSDGVHVALDYHHLILLADRVLGEIERIDE